MTRELITYNYQINERLLYVSKRFLEHFNFNHFIYVKLTSKNKRLYLSTHTKWVETYVHNELFNDIDHEKSVIHPQNKRRHALWDVFKDDRVFEVANNLGMWHGFIIYDGNEIFAFTTHKENTEYVNKCLLNINAFDHFILYFRDAANEVIHPHENVHITSKNQLEENQYPLEHNCNSLGHVMSINNFYLKDKSGNDFQITKREAQTLQLLSNGKTFAEAAFELKISQRTLEQYVISLKHKLNCFSRSKLVDIYYQTTLKNIDICN